MSFNPSRTDHFFSASRDDSTTESFKYFAGRNLNARLFFFVSQDSPTFWTFWVCACIFSTRLNFNLPRISTSGERFLQFEGPNVGYQYQRLTYQIFKGIYHKNYGVIQGFSANNTEKIRNFSTCVWYRQSAATWSGWRMNGKASYNLNPRSIVGIFSDYGL